MAMNKIIIYFVLLITLGLFTSVGFGQSQKSFDALISQTNTYLDWYATLSPFGSDSLFAYKNSGLPKKLVKALKNDADEYDGYTRDSITEFNLLLEYQGLIVENIEALIRHSKFRTNNIDSLIKSDYDLAIISSPDKKLYNFSLDEKTGGSYRSRISFMHYVDIHPDSLPTVLELEEGSESSVYRVFEGDGYDQIDTIETAEGTKYVLLGSVRGCGYCFETNIMVVSYYDEAFEVEFSYAVNSRSWESGVSYDAENKIITVDYDTDDLTPYCNCSYDASYSDEYSVEEDALAFEKKCHCTFTFTGSEFELTKESWEKITD